MQFITHSHITVPTPQSSQGQRRVAHMRSKQHKCTTHHHGTSQHRAKHAQATDPHSAASSTAGFSSTKQRRVEHSSQHSTQPRVSLTHPEIPTRPTDPHALMPTPTDPKSSPQVLITQRRVSLSRSKQRRVAPGHTKWGSQVRGGSVEGYPRTHSPRHDRHPHLPIAVNERAHLEFCEKCRERFFAKRGLPRN